MRESENWRNKLLKRQASDTPQAGSSSGSVSQKTSPLSAVTPDYAGPVTPAASLTRLPNAMHEPGANAHHAHIPNASASSTSPQEDLAITSPASDVANAAARLDSPEPDPFMELLFSGWDPELPDRATLNH
ncbi:hypothetical protein HDZ31DRAFT_70831 [Schizophyllum fasciatum]